MNYQELLPLGTVVRLKNATKPLMITGFCISSPEYPDQLMDYNSCFYPEGIVSSDVNFLFNHDQIEEILFVGFKNEDEVKFKLKLNEIMTKMGASSTTITESPESIPLEQPVEIPIMQQAAPMVDLSDVSQMVETLDVNNQN